jgi:hypothetical protein
VRAEHLGRVEAAPIGRDLDEWVLAVDQDLDNRPIRSIIEYLETKGQDGVAACRHLCIAHVCDVHRYVGTILEWARQPTVDPQFT